MTVTASLPGLWGRRRTPAGWPGTAATSRRRPEARGSVDPVRHATPSGARHRPPSRLVW